MKVITFFLTTLLTLFAVETARAQFGKKYTASLFTPPTVDGARYYGSGQLFALAHMNASNERAYVFINNTTGERQAVFRLTTQASRHGALVSPDGCEILVAGSETTNSQPVFFAGRYNATNLAVIGQMQINTNSTGGFNLNGEVSPDGNFLFGGVNTLLAAHVVAKYGTNFLPKWGTTLKYHGAYALGGTEVYPLPNGDVGFSFVFQGFGGAGFLYTNVVGLLDGNSGLLKWSGTTIASQTGTYADEVKLVFGPDGSLLITKERISFTSGSTNYIGVARVNPNGTLAYSKTLTVTGAAYELSCYLGGDAFFCFLFNSGGNDRVQFVVLDENGNVNVNNALNCDLGSRGLTAARREGTEMLFVRMQCNIIPTPEHSLIRINLTNGVMDLRKLPAPGLGVEEYNLVTTPEGDSFGEQFSPPGFAAVTTAIVGDTDGLGGNGSVGFYELPCDGSFPTCISLTTSSVNAGTPLATSLANESHINLADGATAGTNAMPGMTTPLHTPVLQSLTVTESTICPDDGANCTPAGGDTPVLTIGHAPPGQATISWTPATPGFVLQERTSLTSGSWSNAPSGSTNPITVPATLTTKFYRLFK